MKDELLRVGLVGANPDQSWAKLSHIPAINALPDVKLVAVATSNAKSARAAGEAFGVEEFYASADELALSPNVEIVSVVVKVPYHRDIVLAALNAGKHVLCEWPLAKNVEEAEELAQRAETVPVHAGINLQSRMSPAARRARDLIQSGAIGRPLSANIISTTTGFGGQTLRAYAYFDDPASGANLTTITAGHTLDLAVFLLGGIGELNAMSSIKYPQVEIMDVPNSVPIERTVADHLAIAARFENGCVASIEVDSARPAETPFTFQIIGTDGDLTLRGGSPFGFQGGNLTLEASVPFEAPAPPSAPELQDALVNIGELYEQFARDIRGGEKQTPDFHHAVKLHKLLRSLDVVAESGMRQTPDDWPTD